MHCFFLLWEIASQLLYKSDMLYIHICSLQCVCHKFNWILAMILPYLTCIYSIFSLICVSVHLKEFAVFKYFQVQINFHILNHTKILTSTDARFKIQGIFIYKKCNSENLCDVCLDVCISYIIYQSLFLHINTKFITNVLCLQNFNLIWNHLKLLPMVFQVAQIISKTVTSTPNVVHMICLLKELNAQIKKITIECLDFTIYLQNRYLDCSWFVPDLVLLCSYIVCKV